MNTKNLMLSISGFVLGFLLSAGIILAAVYFTGLLEVKKV